jgi:hypothetical protein
MSTVLWTRMSFHLSIVPSIMPTPIHGWLQDMLTIIDAIPGTWSADQPKKYEPVTVSRLEVEMLGY